MDRVIVTNGFVNICTMQVCAVADAEDDEILAVCNSENRSGTTHGWSRVIRDDTENPQRNPVVCDAHPERRHFLVVC